MSRMSALRITRDVTCLVFIMILITTALIHLPVWSESRPYSDDAKLVLPLLLHGL